VHLDEHVEAQLYALIEELAGTPNRKPGSTAQQIGDFYAGFMNEARLNELGVDPLKPHLAEIDAISDTRQLAEVAGRLSVIGLPGPAGGEVEADAGDPTQVAREKFHSFRSAMQLRADAVKLVFHVDHLLVRAGRSRGILRVTAAALGFAPDNRFVR
jgi:hypothetical protein